MDFSTMSDEELLKPDAETDFSAMSDEELLKPDAKDDISKLSDEELLTRLSTFAWAANFFRGVTPRDGVVCRESSRIAFRNAV